MSNIKDPVTHIAACGSGGAALTVNKQVYVWCLGFTVRDCIYDFQI